jgi:FAD/FMN-containing dehydrogenase
VIAEELKKIMEGEVETDEETLKKYSRDASLFEIKPEVVVYPKDTEDLKRIVRFVSAKKALLPEISLSARCGGSDMTGAPLTDSIVLDFTRHFNHIKEVGDKLALEGMSGGYAVVEPGVFYRDFEKETLKKGYLLPTFPASREICALGGMVANNSGGEKTLIYGKTIDYVKELKVILADGEEYELKPLNKSELQEKKQQNSFEGEIYRRLHGLIEKNYELIKKAKPNVPKNSAGYNLWDVWNGETFDLTKLFVGSQGTLGLITEIKFSLVKPKPYSGMLVVFLKDLSHLAEIVTTVVPFRPSSFESFDDNTFRLALKFWWGFFKLFAQNPFKLAFAFLPEFLMVFLHGLPKLVLLVEFEDDSEEFVLEKLKELRKELISKFKVHLRLAPSAAKAKKYWFIRRESFNLLRKRVKGLQTAPFIDDLVVKPEALQEFLPKLYTILNKYNFFYTIAGHVGDGNIHIIPLMKLADESERAKIKKAMDEVYDLVFKFGGSMTGEHNDGLIRGAYLKQMYGEKIYSLFEEVKKIFDPQNIFNPGKKIGVDLARALSQMKRS